MGLIKKEAQDVSPETERRSKTRDFEGLIMGLSDPDPMVRRWSARDLANFLGASPYLIKQLKKESDRSVKEVIITSLLRLGDKEAVDGLIECLKSEDAHLRNAAIEALKHLPHRVSPIMKEY